MKPTERVTFDPKQAEALMRRYLNENGGAVVAGIVDGEGAAVFCGGSPVMIAGAIADAICDLAYRLDLPSTDVMEAISAMVTGAGDREPDLLI